MPIRVPLQRHPDFPCSLDGIEVEVSRTIGRGGARKLLLTFFARGPMRTLVIPRWRGGGGTRRDELWRTTCFEAFLRVEGESDYYEFNFAPSRDWAAYRFTGYREGMAPARVEVDEVQWAQMHPPRPGESYSSAEHDEYGRTHGWQTAEVDLSQLMDLPVDRPWRVGLSAVIEEQNGRKSWWALAHPPGAPDFHHEACFALELPAARAA
ncbi:MAG TPA: DOMON-like domain-containing protein [Sphingomonas sp.]|nr:DOMON-like domain-containing protein [Sphingomonas sp.]